MNLSSKTKTIVLAVLLIVGVSAVTSLTTTYINNNRNTSANFDSSNAWQAPTNVKARFASAANAMETDFTVAADLTVHAVVHVINKGPNRQMQGDFFNDPFFEFFFGPQQRQRQQAPQQNDGKLLPRGSGSGVIISPDGYIVTNNHVIDGAKEIEVTLNDKRTMKAKLIGTDPSTDIALLKVDAKNLSAITFGDSDNLKVGEWVLAVGNPFNLTSTVTAGIISAKARNLGIIGSDPYGRTTENKLSIESFIQTDAAINPGNSGGALVNTKGELIGINTAIASQTGNYAGYGFAVPSSIVRKVVTDLREHGVVQRALLGVQIGDINAELAKEKNLKTLNGALVGGVVKNGTADKAGIKEGDVINNINGVTVKSTAELQEQVARYSPGDNITIGFMRDNKQMTVKADMKNADGTMEAVTVSKFTEELGVQLRPVNATIKEALGIDAGLEVMDVSQGKFADKGIKEGFIILKINNKLMTSVKDFENVYTDAVKSKKSLNIAGVYPTNGKIAYFEIDSDK